MGCCNDLFGVSANQRHVLYISETCNILMENSIINSFPLLPLPGSVSYVGPGQRSVRRLGSRHRRQTAGSENQGGPRPGRRSGERRPLPLRYANATNPHREAQSVRFL